MGWMDGSVTLGGVDLNVVKHIDSMMECEVPPGEGASLELVVVVGGQGAPPVSGNEYQAGDK